jgi:hypothetical protein
LTEPNDFIITKKYNVVRKLVYLLS